MASKKKLLTSAIALGTAVVMAIGGTFAWQSISQTAVDESSDYVNPGARLHNDQCFDGAMRNNVDIYVENFTNPAEEDGDLAGKDIYARVRVSEYMEIVLNHGTKAQKVVNVAGKKLDKETGKALDNQNVASEQDKYDYEFKIHQFGEETGTNATDTYWNWVIGGQKYYMPTFNKNKDSIAADLNGLYVDAVGGISNRVKAQYDAYTEWDADSDDKTATAIYDADSDKDDELKTLTYQQLSDFIDKGSSDEQVVKDALTNKDIKIKQETHAVGETMEGTVITMEDWLKDYEADDFDEGYSAWIYDPVVVDEDGNETGGWLYWSKPIKPGEATGLLLDSIELKEVMDDTWYYAINVESQFVTANDIGDPEKGTGFYADGETVSEDAMKLLESIGVTTPETGGDDADDDRDGKLFSLKDQNGPAVYAFTADGVGSTTYLKGISFENGGEFELTAENGVTVDVTFGGDDAKGRAKVESTKYDAEEHMLCLEPQYRDPITITATKSKQSYEFTLIPVPTGIVITKGDTAEDVQYTLTPRDYSILPVDFTGDVTYTVEGAKRCKITESNDLSVNVYESAASFTVTATDGSGNSGTVTIILAETTPTDDPVFMLWHSAEESGRTEVGRLIPGGTLYLQAGEKYVIEADLAVDDDYVYDFSISQGGEINYRDDAPVLFVTDVENGTLNYTTKMYGPFEYEGEAIDGILSRPLKTTAQADGQDYDLSVAKQNNNSEYYAWETITLSFKEEGADPDPDPGESGGGDSGDVAGWSSKVALTTLTSSYYEKLCEATGGDDSKMHWSTVYSWTSAHRDNKPSTSMRGLYGKDSATSCKYLSWVMSENYIGMRPAFVADDVNVCSGLNVGDAVVIGTLYEGEEDPQPVKVPTDPTANGDITVWGGGDAHFTLGEALEDESYQMKAVYVGDGVFVCDRVMMINITYVAFADYENDFVEDS